MRLTNAVLALALLAAVFGAGIQIGATRGRVIVVGDCIPHRHTGRWELECRP
jgi:hypothetical protein